MEDILALIQQSAAVRREQVEEYLLRCKEQRELFKSLLLVAKEEGPFRLDWTSVKSKTFFSMKVEKEEAVLQYEDREYQADEGSLGSLFEKKGNPMVMALDALTKVGTDEGGKVEISWLPPEPPESEEE